MTDDAADALDRLRRAARLVRRHDVQRRALAAAVVAARRAGIRPRDIAEAAHYDRNHVSRILRDAGLTEPRPRRDTAA